MFCRYCGKEISENAKFCSECGMDQSVNQAVKTIKLKCEHCGATMDVKEGSNVVYCSYCGTKQLILDSDVVAKEKVKANVFKEIELTKIKNEEVKQNKKEQKEEFNKYKKSKLSKFSIVVAVICLICAFMAFKSKHYLAFIIAFVQNALFTYSWLSGMQIVKEKVKNLHVALAILAFVLIIPYFWANNMKVYEKLEWPNNGIATVIPKPDAKYGELSSYYENSLYATINEASQKDFDKYIDSCINKGFLIESERSLHAYEAYNEDGHKLRLVFYDDYYTIDLDAPGKIEEFSWPNTYLAKHLPAPKSNKGKIKYDNENSLSILIGQTSYEDYQNYIDKVYDAGFNIDYSKGDKYFNASDEEGNKVDISYQGKNIMQIVAYKSEKTDNEKTEVVKEENKVEESVEDNILEINNDVDPDLKKFLDEYESFIDDYIAFMEKYNESDNGIELMGDYIKMMAKYSTMEENLENYDEDNMSDADLAYYLEVTTRCSTKLLNASVE